VLKMIVKVCAHCDRPYELCKFQRGLRNYDLDKFADALVVEKEVPPDV